MPQTMNTGYWKDLTPAEVRVTPAAQSPLVELMQSAEEEFTAIRLFVEGGGCGGMSYSMTYAEVPTEYDSVFQCDGFRIVVDPVALNFVRGCEIDYVKQGINEVFVFNNVFQGVGGSGRCGGCGGSGY